MSPLETQREADLAACVELMRGGSKTFFAASRLLPARVRAASIALYAFCRVADDLVDQPVGGSANLELLRGRLDRIYQSVPGDFVEDHALSLVVQQTGLPRHLLDALLEGFAWDAEGRQCADLGALHAYAARVAGSVGAMMCWIMGQRQPGALARACELGLAMQLTNIARDVGEDARNGRLYLPQDWMRDAGIDPAAWLAEPDFTPALASVVQRLLSEADRLYLRATPGVAELPRDCRAAILAAGLIYAEIGHQLRRDGLDSVRQRTVVGGARKLVLLATAWTQAGWVYTQDQSPEPEPAVLFLVSGCVACADTASGFRPALGFPNRAMPQRVEWVLKLLERREGERRKMRSPAQRTRPPAAPPAI